MTTDILENAIAFAQSDVHEGDPRVIAAQAKAACCTLLKEVERLQVIVARLPKYRDGEFFLAYVPAPGTSGWALWQYGQDEPLQVSPCHTPEDADEAATGFDWIVDGCEDECEVLSVYSTREAAEKARQS